MSEFNWDDHPIVKPDGGAKAFSWDDHPIVQQEPGLVSRIGDTIGGALSKAGKAIDSYTGAPTRAAIGAAQQGNNPFPAFAKQFGENPDTAPTGAQIGAKAGLSTDRRLVMTAQQQKDFDERNNPGRATVMKLPGMKYDDQYGLSPAETAGVGIDMAADPTMLLPLAGEIKPFARLGTGALKAVDAGVEGAAAGLRSAAEKSAVKATGATAVQASKFGEDAGKQLLDRKLVRFADSPAKVSERTAGALDTAHANIDQSLKALDSKGVTVDTNDVYNVIRNRITELSKDPAKADIARALEGELENIIKAGDANGSAKVPISAAENTKRGYNRKARNWMNPEVGQAGKETYQAYRGAVEDAAQAADPALASQFNEGKSMHGLLDPIQEASERRALQQQQSPLGGLLDMATAAAGGAHGGPAGAAAGILGRRAIAPRLASSNAVAMNKAAGLLRSVPQFASIEAKDPATFKALITLAIEKNPGLLKAADQNQPNGRLKTAGDQ